MRNITFFRISRILLIFIVFASVVIPFITLPQSYQSVFPVKLDPIIQVNTTTDVPIQALTTDTYLETSTSLSDSNLTQPTVNSTKKVISSIYLAGVIISILLSVYSVFSVLRLFGKSRKVTVNGVQIMIINEDIPAFSFLQRILISRHDYEINAEEIITHELSHIRHGHFYDLLLMEFIKIIYWFNPLIYKMISDIKDIHEFQADEQTINSGVDPAKYQLLIIQKCVGHQMFTLANSFNHCQIKKRITMMNKSKTGRAGYWKVATFLPLLAILLMAFSKMDGIVTQESSSKPAAGVPSELTQNKNEPFKRKIEIKKDGNYIDNKLCSLQEIAKKGQEWYNASNDWIFLLVDESVPLNRIDEIRQVLGKDYWIVQSTVNSDDLVYFAGDVSKSAKFKQGNFNEWMNKQLMNHPEINSKPTKYEISYSFIIGKDGKVRDGHIIKGSDSPELNTAFEKILNQIPDWEPAKRDGSIVSVYNIISSIGVTKVME